MAAGRVRGGLKGTEIDGEYILGDYIREVTPGGEVDWEWRTEINMEIEKFPLHDFTSREEFSHANSIFDLNGSGYLISSRRSSYLLMIERETKHMTWSGHEGHWGGQHDAQILENGNLLFFANGFKTQGAGLPYSQVIEMNWKPERKYGLIGVIHPGLSIAPISAGARDLPVAIHLSVRAFGAVYSKLHQRGR